MNQQNSRYVKARKLDRLRAAEFDDGATGCAHAEAGEPSAISHHLSARAGHSPLLTAVDTADDPTTPPDPVGGPQSPNLPQISTTPQQQIVSSKHRPATTPTSFEPWDRKVESPLQGRGGSLSPGRALQPAPFAGLSSPTHRQYYNQYESSAPSAGRQDDIPTKIKFLAYMNLLDEETKNSKEATVPLPLLRSHQSAALECNSKFIGSTASREFESTLQTILRLLHHSSFVLSAAERTLHYRETLELVESFRARHPEDDLFLDSKIQILRELAITYRGQNNLLLAEPHLKQLVLLGCQSSASRATDDTTQLADCFVDGSGGLRGVIKTMRLHLPYPLAADRTLPFPPLQRAIRTGFDDVTRELCKRGCQLQDMDLYGQHAVHAAASMGKLPLIQPFLGGNCELVTGRDLLNRPPLFYAAHHGDLACVIALVNSGANITDRDEEGVNILAVAAAAGHAPIVDFLLKRGVSPNDCLLGKPSPLHRAAQGGHKDVCLSLLAHGAWADLKAPTLHTPADFANDGGFSELGRILKGAQQKPANQLGLP